MDPQQIFYHNPDCPASGRLLRAKGPCSIAFAIRVPLSRGSSHYWLMAVRFRRLLLPSA